MATVRLDIIGQPTSPAVYPPTPPGTAWVRPPAIRLEAMGACQLKCPSCPTADNSIRPTIASGYLRAESFKKLIDANTQIRHVELSNYGEIFLNPQLVEILKYAHERGVTISAENGVNLNDVKPEALEAVVKYQVESLTCSIDGASQETYPIYRVKGDYDTVMANVRAIVAHKRRLKSKLPRLVWQFIVFGHNEHELPAARKLAEELEMEFKPKISWDSHISPVKDPEFVMREAGIHATREAFKEKEGVDYSRPICHQLWQDPQINWDGKVLGCCRNFWGDFGGNAFTDGLGEALNNPKITYAREMLMGRQPAVADIPCTTCDIYKGMAADRNFISAPELVQPSRLLLELNSFAQKHRKLYRALRAVYRQSGAKRVVGRWLRRR